MKLKDHHIWLSVRPNWFFNK